MGQEEEKVEKVTGGKNTQQVPEACQTLSWAAERPRWPAQRHKQAGE